MGSPKARSRCPSALESRQCPVHNHTYKRGKLEIGPWDRILLPARPMSLTSILRLWGLTATLLCAAIGCGSSDDPIDPGAGGTAGQGGTSANGGSGGSVAQDAGGGSAGQDSGGQGDAPIDAPSLPTKVNGIFGAFDTAMSACPERLWPAYDWSKSQVLLLDSAKGEAWLWRDPKSGKPDSRTTGPVSASTLPPDLGMFSFFSIGNLDNVLTMGIELMNEPPIVEPFEVHLAVHEGFHFLGGQDDFVVAEEGVRDATWPIAWRPRFLRAEVIRALTEAFVDSDATGVGRARAWRDKLATEDPTERKALLSLDVFEGTAQYVETVGVLIALLGCDATEAQLTEEARKRASDLFMDSAYDRGGESYVIGPLAGMLLRSAQGQGFEQKAKSTPMVDLLLDAASAVAVDETDPAVAARIDAAKKAIDQQNTAIGSELTPFLATWASADHARIAIPEAWSIGSYSLEGGYYVDASIASDQPHVLLGYSASFGSTDGKGKADLSSALLVQADASPCGTGKVVIPVPVASVPAGDHLTFKVGALSMTDAAVERIDSGGFSWVCFR